MKAFKTFKDLNWSTTREGNGFAHVGTATVGDLTIKVTAGEAALHNCGFTGFWNPHAFDSFDIRIVKGLESNNELEVVTNILAPRAGGFSFWSKEKQVLCNVNKARITQLMKRAHRSPLSATDVSLNDWKLSQGFGVRLANIILE